MISAVIITKNEERNIGRCIDSLQGIADEVVVVDSGSTDNTEIICKKKGVRFEYHDWEGYSNQKNYANALATQPWILSIDADEALSDDLKENLIILKNKGLNNNNVYSFNRLTNYCSHWIRHCGWYPDRKIRLWERNTGSWSGEIHETIQFSKQVKEQVLQGDLLHYSFATKQDYENQMYKYARMRGEQYYRKGKKHASLYIAVSPIFSFIRHYFFQLGFLDGKDGFHICRINAKATKLKYMTLKELTDRKQ